MIQIPPSVGALILAGGQNRRMNGQHKALLPFNGKTIIEHQAAVFSGFPERLIATSDPALATISGFTPIADEVPGMGPLAGLAAALSHCQSQALVVCACDMPLVTAEFAAFLAGLALTYPDAPAVIPKDRSGRLHPLCGLYRITTAPAIQTALGQNERRVMRVFESLGGIIFPLSETGFADSVLTNINTPPDLAQLISPDRPSDS